MTRNAGLSWTSEEDHELSRKYKEGVSIKEIARDHERSVGAIRSRLKKNGLRDSLSVSDDSVSNSLERNIDRRVSNESKRRVKTKIVPVNEKQETRDRLLESGRVDESILDAFHYVYFMVNKKMEVYVGCTRDVAHRIYRHNNSLGAKATKGKGPWYPFYIICAISEIEAFEIEARSKREFEALMLTCRQSLKEVLENTGIVYDVKKIQLLKS